MVNKSQTHDVEKSSEALYADAKINHHQIEDATIALRIFGQGPALVLVHGYPVHGYTWRKLLPILAKHFTCHVIDLPGLGNSAWTSNTDFRFTAQVRRLGLLLESLGLSQYSLLAHDTGATIARLLILAQPTQVRKFVMMNTEIPGHRPPWIPLYQHLAALPGAGLFFAMSMRSARFLKSPMGMGEFYSNPNLFNDPDAIKPYVDPLIKSSRRMAGALGYLRGIEWNVVDDLHLAHSKITTDTLCLWGEDDQTFPVDLAEEMSAQLAGKTSFVRIANASLMPHEEQPQEVLRHLMPFLQGV